MKIETYYGMHVILNQLSNITDKWAKECDGEDIVEKSNLEKVAEMLKTCSKLVLEADDYYRK